MYTPDPRQVGRLDKPVILKNLETGLCHSIETIEILQRCNLETMKIVDRKTGMSKLLQIYREATPAEIKAWEALGRKKRGERERTVAESRIRNAPAVVMVGPNSPAAAAAEKAQADKLRDEAAKAAEADRADAAKTLAEANAALADAKALADTAAKGAEEQAAAEAKATADAKTAADADRDEAAKALDEAKRIIAEAKESAAKIEADAKAAAEGAAPAVVEDKPETSKG